MIAAYIGFSALIVAFSWCWFSLVALQSQFRSLKEHCREQNSNSFGTLTYLNMRVHELEEDLRDAYDEINILKEQVVSMMARESAMVEQTENPSGLQLLPMAPLMAFEQARQRLLSLAREHNLERMAKSLIADRKVNGNSFLNALADQYDKNSEAKSNKLLSEVARELGLNIPGNDKTVGDKMEALFSFDFPAAKVFLEEVFRRRGFSRRVGFGMRA